MLTIKIKFVHLDHEIIEHMFIYRRIYITILFSFLIHFYTEIVYKIQQRLALLMMPLMLLMLMHAKELVRI